MIALRRLFEYRARPQALEFWRDALARQGLAVESWLRSRGWVDVQPDWWGLRGGDDFASTTERAMWIEMQNVALASLRIEDERWDFSAFGRQQAATEIDRVGHRWDCITRVRCGRRPGRASFLATAFIAQLERNSMTLDAWLARVIAGGVGKVIPAGEAN